jgi:hypothetical protein
MSIRHAVENFESDLLTAWGKGPLPAPRLLVSLHPS